VSVVTSLELHRHNDVDAAYSCDPERFPAPGQQILNVFQENGIPNSSQLPQYTTRALCIVFNVEARHCLNMHSIASVTRREIRYVMVSVRAFSRLDSHPPERL
jgi:hypothetical protein